ncbi:MAG: CPBP family intramembrane glutamate endopeptidase [Bacteroidota bacterium]|nr:CPBP family intramembrane glutamate endopeptidase [Bacteroidota bacterium]
MNQNNKIRWFEILAVIFTGIFKFLFVNVLSLQLLFITLSILFWGFYIIYRKKKNKNILKYWGFTRTNFFKAFKMAGVFAFILIGIFTANAIFNQYQLFDKHLLYVLLLYPVWGLIQQFMMMSLILGNLKDVSCRKIPEFVYVIIASILFSAVHFPSVILMIITFILALYYSQIFLRYRNLYALGLFHGWIGSFFYYYVLNFDSWEKVILPLLNLQ